MGVTATDIIKRAEEDRIQFISLQLTDLFGTVKNITVPTAQLPRVLDRGMNFDGSSIMGVARISESDMMLRPDPNTYAVMPWTAAEDRTARLLCDVYTPAGNPFPGDPRGILRRTLARAEAMGYRFNTGPELEFFLFRQNGDRSVQPTPNDTAGYFDFSPRDTASHVRNRISLAATAMGIEVEATHHEAAIGQHEIDFRYAEALTSADMVMTTRYVIKAIAQEEGLYATFMPKPLFGVPGSGMHVHQSLFTFDGQNAFYDANDDYRLSKTAYAFMAGQMKHARALAAIIAPTVNSYKRLVPGYEAPAYICWGQTNRSALIRIPGFVTGMGPNSVRCELRCPDSSANPYLAFAVMLAAGLDGIEQGLKVPPPVEENVYEYDMDNLERHGIASLPGTLGEALDEMAKSQVIADCLGEHTFKRYIEAKRAEWDQYRIRVTPWELDRYL